MSFKDAINIMANQEGAAKSLITKKENQINETIKQIELNKANMTITELEEAFRNLNFLKAELDAIIEDFEKENAKYCSKCGGYLKPYSVNWFEGFHIDGCED